MTPKRKRWSDTQCLSIGLAVTVAFFLLGLCAAVAAAGCAAGDFGAAWPRVP